MALLFKNKNIWLVLALAFVSFFSITFVNIHALIVLFILVLLALGYFVFTNPLVQNFTLGESSYTNTLDVSQ